MNIRCQHSCFSGLFLAFAMPLPGPDYVIEIQWIVLIPHSGNQPFSCTTDISFEFRIHGICSSKCQTLDCKIPSVTAPDDQYRFLCIVEQHKKLLSKAQPFLHHHVHKHAKNRSFIKKNGSPIYGTFMKLKSTNRRSRPGFLTAEWKSSTHNHSLRPKTVFLLKNRHYSQQWHHYLYRCLQHKKTCRSASLLYSLRPWNCARTVLFLSFDFPIITVTLC